MVHSSAHSGKPCMARRTPCAGRSPEWSARTAWAPSWRHNTPTAGTPLKPAPTPCWPPWMTARRTVSELAPASSAVLAALHQPGWIPFRSQELLNSRRVPDHPPTPPWPCHPATQCPHHAVWLWIHPTPLGHRPRHSMLRPRKNKALVPRSCCTRRANSRLRTGPHSRPP
jgi:hypothetical protein